MIARFTGRLTPLILTIGVVLVLAGSAAVFAGRHAVSSRTLYQLDTRLWFLQLKFRGDVPQVSWTEALRRVGPGWSRRERFDVARVGGNGPAPCTVRWQTPLGTFWGTERDGRELDLLMLEQAGGDIYEQRSVSVREDDVVIDVGAHLGTFTRIALMRGAGRVIAVEPDPVNAACFARTFAPEIAAGRVTLVAAAAWHSPGSLTFERGSASQTGRVSDSEGDRAVTVRAVTLDQIVEQSKVDRVDFIKMDIEGAERHALAGARRLLSAYKPRLAICIYHAADDPEFVPRAVFAANDSYHTFTRDGFQAYFY